MNRKLATYAQYFWEYSKNGDLGSITSSVRYLLYNKSHPHDRIIRSSIGTFFCRKNTNDFQFANYRYEWGVKRFLLNRRSEFNVFIDGGSCVGEYCVLLTKMGIRCIAFEPVIANYNVLARNMELNGMGSKVQALSVGLGDRNMLAPFCFNPVNTGASHIIDDTMKPDCIVEIRTFDDLLAELNLHPEDRIMFKLDVEQMECQAIQGSADFIKAFPNLTFVIEEKHSGEGSIRKALSKIGRFEFGIVDEYNMYARKLHP